MAITRMSDFHIERLSLFVRGFRREQQRELTDDQLALVQVIFRQMLSNDAAHCLVYEAPGEIVGYLAMHLVEFPMLSGREEGCVRMMLNNPREYESYKRSYYQGRGYEERTGFANFVKYLG